MSEDLPYADNRIALAADGRVTLDLTERNMEGHHRLKAKLEGLLDALDLLSHPALPALITTWAKENIPNLVNAAAQAAPSASAPTRPPRP